MIEIKLTTEFNSWLLGLKDASVRGIIAARLKRLSLGLSGDVKPVGDGVSELRIHVGAGWRIYFVQRDPRLIVLLIGGSKRTQAKDIKRAKTIASHLVPEGEDDAKQN